MTQQNLAAPELAAIDVQGVTRQAFLVRGAVTAGAVYGLASVGPFVREALAQEGGGDVEVLNFALTLEYLEAAFYTQALKQVGDLQGDVKSLATEIRDNETAHVDALKMTIQDLGGTPVKYTGIRQKVGVIAEALALQEDVDLVGLSVLSGAHVGLARQVLEALRANVLEDVKLVIGGTIPASDRQALLDLGVDAVFDGDVESSRSSPGVDGLWKENDIVSA